MKIAKIYRNLLKYGCFDRISVTDHRLIDFSTNGNGALNSRINLTIFSILLKLGDYASIISLFVSVAKICDVLAILTTAG